MKKFVEVPEHYVFDKFDQYLDKNNKQINVDNLSMNYSQFLKTVSAKKYNEKFDQWLETKSEFSVVYDFDTNCEIYKKTYLEKFDHLNNGWLTKVV